MLNDDQKDHIASLNNGNICGCGWHTRDSCVTYCFHPKSRNPEEQKIVDRINMEINININILKQIQNEFYPLQQIEKYKDSNLYRNGARTALEKAMLKLAERIQRKGG